MKDKIELIVEAYDEAFDETEPAACLIAQRLGIAEGDTCAAIFGCDTATYERCLAEAKRHAREDSSYAEKLKNVQLEIQARMIDDASTANCWQPASCESSTDRWAHVQTWLQEAGLVIDYQVSRTIEKRRGSFPAKSSALFMQTADAAGAKKLKIPPCVADRFCDTLCGVNIKGQFRRVTSTQSFSECRGGAAVCSSSIFFFKPIAGAYYQMYLNIQLGRRRVRG